MTLLKGRLVKDKLGIPLIFAGLLILEKQVENLVEAELLETYEVGCLVRVQGHVVCVPHEVVK